MFGGKKKEEEANSRIHTLEQSVKTLEDQVKGLKNLNSELERQEDLFAVKEEETPKTVDFTVTSPRTFVQDHSAAAIIPAKEDSVNETKLTGPTIEEWINSVLKAVVEKMSMPARF